MQGIISGQRFQSLGRGKLWRQHAGEACAILPRRGAIGENRRGVHHAAQRGAFSAQRRQNRAKCCAVRRITGMGAGARTKGGQNAQGRIHARRGRAAARNQRDAPGASGSQPFGAFQAKALCAPQHHIGPGLIRLPGCGLRRRRQGRTDHQLADMAGSLKLAKGRFRFFRWKGAIGQGCQRTIRKPSGDIAQQCFRQGGARARQRICIHGEIADIAPEGAEPRPATFGKIALAQFNEAAKG